MPDDRLAAAVAELYAASPENFTPRRGELAALARDAGDRAAAKAIGALRRPTRAAWVLNTLARADPGAAPRLTGLAAVLRAAQAAGDGRRLRELSAERGAVIDGLTERALAGAGAADAPPALRLEVSQTLTAALADPDVAAEFAAGTLTRAMQWSGFGVAPAGDGPETAEKAQFRSAPVAAPRAAAAGTSAPDVTKPAKTKLAKIARTEPNAAARRQTEQTEHRRPEPAARRAEETERWAREAAERAAAQRREQYEGAERAVATASLAATEAVATEDRLEEEVRDLEQRLSQARADLEAARLRARRAEGAERRARQARSRLPRS